MNPNLRVIALNGPPRSGKDTIANNLEMQLEAASQTVMKVQLSLPMRKAIFALIGREYNEFEYEMIKDLVHPLLGCTIREAMIRLSEQWVKPAYGADFWVRAAMSMVGVGIKYVIISDLGFAEEGRWLSRALKAGNLLITHMQRDGFDWKNDSRGYVYPDTADSASATEIRMTNEQSMLYPAHLTTVVNDDLPHRVAARLRKSFDQFGWR